MKLQKVYINGKETGLVVDGFDIEEDSIYLSAHRKEDEFPEMMKIIGNPSFSKEKTYDNKIRKIFKQHKDGKFMKIHSIQFNFGFVTLDIEHPNHMSYYDIANVLGISVKSEFGYPKVLPILETTYDTPLGARWIYTINCRNEYYKHKYGWPESIPCKGG